MSHQHLVTLVGLTLIAMVMLTFWRKVLLLLIAVFLAVFFFGAAQVAGWVHG